MKTFIAWIKAILRKVLGMGIEVHEVVEGLFQTSAFSKMDWELIQNLGIGFIIDLNGDADEIPGITVLRWPIEDKEELPDRKRLFEVAQDGLKQLKAGIKVMVHCSLGKNRSGLVVGMILILMGMSGKEAVKLIQAKVPGALFNNTFREFLEDYKSETK